MTRAERRRQARMQEKCQVPLNLNLTVAQVSGMTGQQASILQTYLKRMEQQTTETATDAVIREAQEKLERAEDYITVTNIIISLYAIKLATVYKGNIIKNLIMDCQSYTKYRPNETTGGIFVSWRRKEELPTGA